MPVGKEPVGRYSAAVRGSVLPSKRRQGARGVNKERASALCLYLPVRVTLSQGEMSFCKVIRFQFRAEPYHSWAQTNSLFK